MSAAQRCQPDRNGCQHSCVESSSEAHCQCNAGFQLEVDKKSCRDVDECRLGTSECRHHCHNTLGSYSCSSRPGFELAQDGKNCVDINECLDQNGGCEQICNNAQGQLLAHSLYVSLSTICLSPIGQASQTAPA